MKTGSRGKTAARVVTAEEKKRFTEDIEKEHPGYLYENVKLSTIVWTLTGVRILYSFFYLYLTYVFKSWDGSEWMNFFSSFIFLIWYSWMLRTGKGVAVLMLLLRGIVIVFSGVSVLTMALWTPPLMFTLIFASIFAIVLEFAEAVFCIYVLFNGTAAQTIGLNREMDRSLLTYGVSKTVLGEMAEYKNSYNEETETDDAAEDGRDGK